MSGAILSHCLSQVIETWLQQMVRESLISQQWFIMINHYHGLDFTLDSYVGRREELFVKYQNDLKCRASKCELMCSPALYFEV